MLSCPRKNSREGQAILAETHGNEGQSLHCTEKTLRDGYDNITY
jgi:hypothetical protein